MTNVFAEFQVLRAVDPRTRSKGRGELAALEVLNTAIDQSPDLEAVLLFEDSDVRMRRFVRGLPEQVTALSTGDLLHELEAAGRIQSSDRILDVAAEKERNVELPRQPSADEAARHALPTPRARAAKRRKGAGMPSDSHRIDGLFHPL